MFGKPSRITARTFLGRGGIVDIEREAKTGGRIHSKGVLILSGYLGGRYAGQAPLSMSASLALEQIYEEVEGDSASSAEFYAPSKKWCRGTGPPIEQNSLPQVFGWSWGNEPIMERTFRSANGRPWKVIGTGWKGASVA